MKHVNVEVAGTASSVKWPIALKDKCHIVSLQVVCGVDQTTGSVTVGENSGTTTVFAADLASSTAMVPVKGAYTASITDATKNTIFGPDKPIELDVNLGAVGKIGVMIELDPFLVNNTI